MLTQGEIETLVARIVARIDPERVIIFGSYAKGAPTGNSDLDILVIKETDAPMAHRADDLRPIVATSVIGVDLHIYTPEEVEAYANDALSFLSSVLRTGRTVFERTAGGALAADTAIVSENIRALGVLYAAAMLEELRMFQVADRLSELFMDGLLPIGRSGAAETLLREWNEVREAPSDVERRALYALAFGGLSRDPAGTPNREFDRLWLRFVAAVVALAGDQDEVRTAARDLAANLSSRPGPASMARPVRRQIDAATKLLSDQEIAAIYGTRSMAGLIERVTAVEWQGKSSAHHLTMAESGVIVFAWLGKRSGELSRQALGHLVDVDEVRGRSARSGAHPINDPTDGDLVSACEQWLAAAALNAERVVREAVDALLSDSAALARLPGAPRELIARDTARVARGFLEGVDIPEFVTSLIQGVFGAIVDASIQQMEAYGRLVSSVAASIDQMRVNDMTEGEACDRLSEQFPGLLKPEVDGCDGPPVSCRYPLLARMLATGVRRISGAGTPESC